MGLSLQVTQPRELENQVFAFFDRFPLRGSKANDLLVFHEITTLVRSGVHLSVLGIEKLLEMRAPMNRGGRRRYLDERNHPDLEGLEILRGHTQSSLFEAEG
jgi:hypothetical protein